MNLKLIIRFTVIGLTSLAIYFSVLSNPTYSPDMIGHVASAYSADGFSGEDLRIKTVQDIKSSLSEKKYKAYLAGSEFWSIILSDSKSLPQWVPYYSIRVIYIELMRFIHLFDVSYTTAGIQVAAIFGALSVLALASIIIKVNLSIATLPLVICVTNLLWVASIPGPDILVCCFALITIYMLMIDSKLIFPLVVLLPLVKTDMVILSGILMLYYYFMDKSKNKYTLIITSVCSIIMLIIVNKVHGNYGYLNLFNLGHINQNKTLYPADIVASTRISDYVLPYIWLIRDALNNSQAVFYMIAILIFIYSKKIGYDIKYKYPLFVIPFVYVLLHIVAFPTYTERYFIFPIMLILIGITHFLKYQLAELSSNN